MSARILIVEDEEPLTLLLRYNLEAEGYEVDTVGARRRGRDQAEGNAARPRRARLDAARHVRHRAVPAAARARRNRAAARHHADRARRGKRARARARHRRRRLHRQAVLGAGTAGAHPRAAAPRAARTGRAPCSAPAISSSTARRSASRAPDARSHLGPTEFRLLEFLMQSPGRVYSREQLLDGVWGRDIYIDERTVDVHVGRLRKALNRGRAARPDPHRARRRLLRSTSDSASRRKAAARPVKRAAVARRPVCYAREDTRRRALLCQSAAPVPLTRGPAAGRGAGRSPAGRRCAHDSRNRACPIRSCRRRRRNPAARDRRSANGTSRCRVRAACSAVRSG